MCEMSAMRASLVAQRLKQLPPMWETRVRSLGQEDPLEKEMATHSIILAWRIPWTEKLGRLQSMGSQRVGQDRVTSLSLSSKTQDLTLSQTFLKVAVPAGKSAALLRGVYKLSPPLDLQLGCF